MANPKEPTLTCSEVVERLHREAFAIGDVDGLGWFLPKLAEKILDEWRERRVQELEGLLAKHTGCSRGAGSASHITSAHDSTEIRGGSK